MNPNEQSAGTAKPVTASGALPVLAAVEITVPDVKKAKAAMDAFEDLKNDLLIEGQDKVKIGDKYAITRAGFSKIALAFGVSTRIQKVSRLATDKDYIVHVVAEAIAPGGRIAEGTASCSKSEFRVGKIEGTIHNIESKAATRATNRAVANLVGGGVLSKEELEIGEGEVTEYNGASDKQKNFARQLADVLVKQQKIISLEALIANEFGKEYKNLDELSKAQASTLIEKLRSYEK